LWYTDSNPTESPLPYSPKPFELNDHPATPPQELAPTTPIPEPQQLSKKRSRSPEPWSGYEDLEALFGGTSEITRELDFFGDFGLKRQRCDPDPEQ